MKEPSSLPDPKGIDAIVGGRVRKRRRDLGMSAKELADIVGVTHIQITHYEAGLRRMASARLFGISQALHVPVAYFFSDLDNQELGSSDNVAEHGNKADEIRQELILELTSRLGRMAANIKDPETKSAIKDLLKGLPDLPSKPIKKK